MVVSPSSGGGGLATDPRDAAKVEEYSELTETEEAQMAQAQEMVSMAIMCLAFVAMMTRSRFIIWIVAFAAFSNWSLSRSGTQSVKGFFSLIGMAVSGLLMVYLQPFMQPASTRS